MRVTVSGRLLGARLKDGKEGKQWVVGELHNGRTVQFYGDPDADGLRGLLNAPELAPVTFQADVFANVTRNGSPYLSVRVESCVLSSVDGKRASA